MCKAPLCEEVQQSDNHQCLVHCGFTAINDKNPLKIHNPWQVSSCSFMLCFKSTWWHTWFIHKMWFQLACMMQLFDKYIEFINPRFQSLCLTSSGVKCESVWLPKSPKSQGIHPFWPALSPVCTPAEGSVCLTPCYASPKLHPIPWTFILSSDRA